MSDPHPSDDDQTATRWRPETLAVAAGRPERTIDAPLNEPITPASTYVAAADPTGTVGYGRYGNPGWTALEAAVGALEGGPALAFASGMAAAHALLELVPDGGVLVLQQQCYLGVGSLAAEYAQRQRFTLRLVDGADTEAVLAAAEGADLVWLETPANPTMEVADVRAVAAGRPEGALLVVDNTFATPVQQRPLTLGADLALHSATKFLSGHSDALCGMVVAAPGRQDLLDRLGAVRRLHGATPGVLETFLVLRGLRTLPLRVRQATASAGELARRLAGHPAILRVRYPGLTDDRFHALAATQMDGFGSLVSIELAGAAAAETLIERLRLWVHATSLGGVESTLERRRRWPAELPAVPEGLVRMSVGLEHVEDLWDDLDQALRGL
ncbi:cystathionine gamma-synthase [Friedmanniella endophytica]|uniref:Cystathionine gamma-synthase n=1 Tax=Microlunatus kandeliicorticis TaxID=1759536 RepID=A0A7W3IUD8_9ACTN|nr:PLP-dependent transferase [Microlunatus kandeliicorticis]MBA8795446.1 cystathionine gamma-synthase [Microlunatus kandeliicorticis]